MCLLVSHTARCEGDRCASLHSIRRDGAVDIGPTNTPSGIRTIHHNQQPSTPEVSKERWDAVLGGVGWWEPLGKGGWLDGVGLGGFANLSDSMGLQF